MRHTETVTKTWDLPVHTSEEVEAAAWEDTGRWFRSSQPFRICFISFTAGDSVVRLVTQTVVTNGY